MEVEYMTLLERDKEKFKEGQLETIKAILDVLDDETIALKTGVKIEVIKELRKSSNLEE